MLRLDACLEQRFPRQRQGNPYAQLDTQTNLGVATGSLRTLVSDFTECHLEMNFQSKLDCPPSVPDSVNELTKISCSRIHVR